MRFLYHLADVAFVTLMFVATCLRPEWGGTPLIGLFFYPILRYVALWSFRMQSNINPTFDVLLALVDIGIIAGMALWGTMTGQGHGGAIFGSLVLVVLFFFRPLIKKEAWGLLDDDQPTPGSDATAAKPE